jgi:hypothetical protein
MNNTIILFIAICVCILYFIHNHRNEQLAPISKQCSKCWVNKNEFPEAEYIFANKHIIKKELLNVITSDKWSKWDASTAYDDKTPIFTKMTHGEINDRLDNSHGKINPNEKSWKLYGLMLNKQILKTAVNCPNTMQIINKFPDRILNVGFSLLEPHAETKPHKDFNNKFYRLHIPMIIPKNNAKYKKNNNTSIVNKKHIKNNLAIFQVENDHKIWTDDEYFIFDDTCMHNAWNNTNENRIVLLVDLLKNN